MDYRPSAAERSTTALGSAWLTCDSHMIRDVTKGRHHIVIGWIEPYTSIFIVNKEGTRTPFIGNGNEFLQLWIVFIGFQIDIQAIST